MKNFLTLFSTLLLLPASCLSTGCLGRYASQMQAFPSDLAQITKAAVDKVVEQGVLDKYAANIDGHVQNPGVAVATVIEIRGEAHLIGINGNLELTQEGHGTQFSPQTLGTLVDELKNPNLSWEQKQQIWNFLMWRHTQSTGAGPPINQTPVQPGTPDGP